MWHATPVTHAQHHNWRVRQHDARVRCHIVLHVVDQTHRRERLPLRRRQRRVVPAGHQEDLVPLEAGRDDHRVAMISVMVGLHVRVVALAAGQIVHQQLAALGVANDAANRGVS
eukprot:scaffold15422_cov107-Isochrysis_galbana.AAC.5